MLPNTGMMISYNGVAFNSGSTKTVNAQARPVYDSSGRTVKFVTYSLTIQSVVGEENQAVSQTTDATLEGMRRALNTPGGMLQYNGVGLGNNITINNSAGGGVRDVNFGPKPQVIQFELFAAQAANVTFAVEWSIPECTGAIYEQGILEWVYRVAWDVDKSGFTKRTVSGHITIPQSRQTAGTRTLTDVADRLREQVNPGLIEGFRRIPGRFTLDEPKSRLDFEVVDEEMPPNVPPPGVVEVDLDHAVATSSQAGGRYTSTVVGKYEMARDADLTLAMRYFLQYVSNRMNGANLVPFPVPGAAPGNAVILKGFSARRSMHAKPGVTLTAQYTFSSRLDQLVLSSGLWTLMPNSN